MREEFQPAEFIATATILVLNANKSISYLVLTLIVHTHCLFFYFPNKKKITGSATDTNTFSHNTSLCSSPQSQDTHKKTQNSN